MILENSGMRYGSKLRAIRMVTVLVEESQFQKTSEYSLPQVPE